MQTPVMRVCGLMLLWCMGIAPGSVVAQESAATFPARPITLVVPAQPGASFDITARLYAQKLGDSLRQPVVLEHKPGAGGTIAYAHVAKAAPNGYTMMLVTPTFVLTGLLYKDLAWDVQKSFAPISHTSSAPYVFYVHPALPVRNLQEYMAHAKANPGVLNMGTSGAGSINHVGGEWLHSLIGARATFVHYKTSPLLLTDMLSGRIQGSISSIPFVKSHVAAGKFKPLGLTGTVRTPVYPDLPTLHEQGAAGYDLVSWFGFVAPARTPAAIVNRLSSEYAKAVKSPDVLDTLKADGALPVGSTPEQFAQLLAADVVRWRKIIQDRNIVLEE
jgi:tripartite-type tricarboxylate transporter receptor subunit TctC